MSRSGCSTCVGPMCMPSGGWCGGNPTSRRISARMLSRRRLSDPPVRIEALEATREAVALNSDIGEDAVRFSTSWRADRGDIWLEGVDTQVVVLELRLVLHLTLPGCVCKRKTDASSVRIESRSSRTTPS